MATNEALGTTGGRGSGPGSGPGSGTGAGTISGTAPGSGSPPGPVAGGATPGAVLGAAAPDGADNAFDGAFLDRLLEWDQPSTAARAAVAGPWEVRPAPGYGWGVWRQGDDGEPAGLMDDRQEALLLAAALPGSHRRDVPRLEPERGPDGYRVTDGRRELGRLAWFDTELVAAVGLLRTLVASPRELALLLEAAGHDALEQAGRVLARRAAGRDRG